ncbi:Fur family transcriptional regulator [Anaerovorax odorimutans]|uniref:Fur family transcriptional regulator n=1 Tax=Anaerovorax odorimutans TaxID=109327 RepID=UPI000409607F|nr:transcriptional repressor [Anaerovorax odorimutans]
MDKNIELENLLKDSGLKNTKHRVAVLKFLKNVKQPVNAEEIYYHLIENNISINLSTVYRTLETLYNKELLLKHIVTDEKKALYEYNNKAHKHFLVCISCKKMLSIENCPLGDYEKFLEEKTDFIITGHKLNIYGYCPECQKKGLIGE